MKIFAFELSVKGETIFYSHSGEDGCTTAQAKEAVIEAICDDLIVSELDIIFVSENVTER